MGNKNIKLIIKRTFDIVFSLIGIVLSLPIILVCGILIRVNLGNPIFFKQTRVGKDNKKFEMIKLRTMKDSYDKNGVLLPDCERMTKLGSILRNLSIDELPEFINILKGDMSFVGPRPLLVEYLNLYNERQIRRHDVIPGLTGWAQINGRNNLSWKEKFELDIWYVENWSLYLDMKIIFLTFYKVIKKDGINQEGQATVEDFNGYN